MPSTLEIEDTTLERSRRQTPKDLKLLSTPNSIAWSKVIFLEADSYSACQEYSSILGNGKVHDHICKWVQIFFLS